MCLCIFNQQLTGGIVRHSYSKNSEKFTGEVFILKLILTKQYNEP